MRNHRADAESGIGDAAGQFGVDFRALVRAEIDRAVREGRVFWQRDGVVDSPLSTGPLRSKVRYVPDFAFRQLLYDAPETPPVDRCRLCAAVDRAEGRLRPGSRVENALASVGWWRRFDGSFAVRLNNFPYFEGQLVVITREHRAAMSPCDYRILLEFMTATGLRAAAMQVAGSGATIPEHAHITLADESLPIFGLPARPTVPADRATVDLVPGYPGTLLVISGGGIPHRVELLAGLLDDLDRRGLAFNLFVNDLGSVYLIPRSAECSGAIERKIGSVEVAGVFLGNALGADTRDVERLRRLIRARCDAMTGERFLTALKQTVCPPAVGLQLLGTARARDGQGAG